MRATKVARVDNSEKSTLHDKLPLSTPYSIHIDVCSICNFKCNFCFQADTEGMDKMGLVRDRMDMAVFKKIANDLTAFPEKVRKVKIGLHGEPTLHPQLPEMVAYMKSKNIAGCIELFTNGSRLNPTLNKALADAGLDRVNISLEALTTERYREIAKAKIDMAKFNANVADLGTHRSIRLHIKIADQIGALALTEDERELFYSTYGDMCDEIFIERVVPQWPDVSAAKMTRKGMYGQEIKQTKNACPFLFMYMHFNSDGTVAGCTLDWGRKVLIGNITKNTAREIWEGDQLNSLQVAHLEGRRCDIDVCDNCNAPMLCAKEDLDPHAKDILQLIRRTPAA